MTPQILDWIETRVKLGVIPTDGAILEVGSRNVNGGIRHLFDQKRYYGIDLEMGPGVDRVQDIHTFRPNANLDLVICLEMIEHDSDPIAAVQIMRWALKQGGILVLSAPTTGFPEHRYPKDYWRFMRDAYTDIFFKGMSVLAFDEVRCPQGYPGLIGCARKL